MFCACSICSCFFLVGVSFCDFFIIKYCTAKNEALLCKTSKTYPLLKKNPEQTEQTNFLNVINDLLT